MSKKKEQEHNMLYQMLLIRRFEERAQQQYQRQKIGGFLHLYIGQEAVAVGSIAALREDDCIITAYRDHGHALARGSSADACMAELFGKTTGISKGLGGSMHYFDKGRHNYGGHAIVGGHVPLGAGLAFASKYRGEDRVTVCYMGDGAIHQGAFHEALNLAGLWELPVLYVIENNHFAMGTHVHRSSAVKELHHRGRGYDMPSSVVDGMNVREVKDAVGKLVSKMRKKPAPHLLEARTYRYRGHSMSDPAKYRTKEELEKHKENDPIVRHRALLTEEKMITEEEFEELDKKAKKIAADSVKFAEESEDPPLDELYNYTFVNGEEA